MTEIPEHLLRRAQVARERAIIDRPSSRSWPEQASGSTDEVSTGPSTESRIPNELLDRSRSARERDGARGASAEPTTGSARNEVLVVERAGEGVASTIDGPPFGAGPGGHTQRLLTVVKSGSIQQVKATPVDKVHTWPHLLAAEFVAALTCLTFVFVFSVFVNAPLLEAANNNLTPNPSKAPWYFLGLQELIQYFHPMIAGVTLPGVGMIMLIMTPYLDKNPSNKPEDRKFATCMFTMFIFFWAVLTIIGSFFRGPGQNFVFPWRDGLFFEL